MSAGTLEAADRDDGRRFDLLADLGDLTRGNIKVVEREPYDLPQKVYLVVSTIAFSITYGLTGEWVGGILVGAIAAYGATGALELARLVVDVDELVEGRRWSR